MTTASGSGPAKKSGVETTKETSRFLRGQIVRDLNDGTDHVAKDTANLLKFHGTYQQEDRDNRKRRAESGVHKFFMFMVRCKIPGGRVTADQYLTLDRLADEHGNGTLRFTTRQGIQFHGVVKAGLHPTIHAINQTLLTTLGACGDVERNVMSCPAPIRGPRDELQAAAAHLATHLAPRTRAYHEIWINGLPLTDLPGIGDDEPMYGKAYLPRKFKTGLTLPEDNCIDVFAQDLGLVAEVQLGKVVGYTVLVGGGMGMSHGNANTFPFLARPICQVPAADLVPIAEATIKLFRDHGNRADRKRARIKYVVHDWGVPRFRAVLQEYFGRPLEDPRLPPIGPPDLHHGWQAQGDGHFFYGVSVENGRVKDQGPLRLRSALRTLVERLQPELRLTPNQDVLLCNLPEGAKGEVEAVLAEHGVPLPERISRVRSLSLACPAIPTCGLALTESERVLPGVIDRLEQELARLGLAEERLTVRMTGCPNGCARPYQSDVGLVGRSGDKFTVFVGGRPHGDRLNFLFKDLVPVGEIVGVLVPLLEAFARERQTGEGFGDFCTRLGAERLQALGA